MPEIPAIETKQCPACAEEVKAAAVICKHCGYDFAAGKMPQNKPISPSAPASANSAKPHSTIGDGVRLGCGMFVMLPILLLLGVLIFGAIISGMMSAH
jgi:hypothetical protein